MCLHSRLDRNLPTSPVLSLSKFRSSAEAGISPIGTYTPRSCSSQSSAMLLAVKSILFFCLDISSTELFEFQTAKGMENIQINGNMKLRLLVLNSYKYSMWERADGACLQQRSSKVTWNYTWNLTLCRRWIFFISSTWNYNLELYDFFSVRKCKYIF